MQRGIVQVLSPVQAGASKVLSPVRDVANWVSDTLRAKSQRDQLRRQVNQLTAEVDLLKTEQLRNRQLAREVKLDQNIGLANYHLVGANVIGRDPSLWYQQVTVDAGSDEGVTMNDPVVADGALVGDVTTVDPSVSIVTLMTDHAFAVAAQVLNRAGDTGVLAPSVGNPNQLLLQDLPGTAQIAVGDKVVTSGLQGRPADLAVSGRDPDRHRLRRQSHPAVQQQPGAGRAGGRPAAFRLGPDPDPAARRQHPGAGAVSMPSPRLIIRLVLLGLVTVVIQEAALSQISIFGISADLTPLDGDVGRTARPGR